MNPEVRRLTRAVDEAIRTLNDTRAKREECERTLEALKRREAACLAEVHRAVAVLTEAL